MPLQNRVIPTGDIVAIPARGSFTGNRGIIHRLDRTLGTARWTHKAWICCVLEWQGRTRPVMTGRNWTELFFLDEAVAFAAGHRPCGYCRRADYNRFCAAWETGHGRRLKAPEMDAALHHARVRRDRSQIRHARDFAELPDGAFVIDDDQPLLVWQEQLWPYTPLGYGKPRPCPQHGPATVLTPAPIIPVLSAGYIPRITFPLQESDILDVRTHKS